MNEVIDGFNEKLKQCSAKEYPERKVVCGDGNINSRVMLIGEAPGGDEEAQGKPFVGKAGRNLMSFLAEAGLNRDDVYITNVVKIRPVRISEKTGKPVNRPPSKDEKDFFSSLLYEEIDIINPKYIITLGNVPLQAVVKDSKALIGDYHGKEIGIGDKILFPLYHPAAIIYNRSLESVYEGDIKRLFDCLNKGE